MGSNSQGDAVLSLVAAERDRERGRAEKAEATCAAMRREMQQHVDNCDEFDGDERCDCGDCSSCRMRVILLASDAGAELLKALRALVEEMEDQRDAWFSADDGVTCNNCGRGPHQEDCPAGRIEAVLALPVLAPFRRVAPPETPSADPE